MLTNWNHTAGRECERKLSQRWKLVPLFRRIAQDPFDRVCFVIEAYKEIFPARNNHGVIRSIVRCTVAMKPVDRCWMNELARIVSPCDHGRTDDGGHVPLLQNLS